jgi:membrane protease YdiL (CAAX protease family)
MQGTVVTVTGLFLALAVLFSIVALVFGLMALATLYFEDPNVPDALYAWGPFAIVCSFLALGTLGAARAAGSPRDAFWQQPLALAIGGLVILIGLVAGVVGVMMAPSATEETFYHGMGWLAFGQTAAIVGAAWLIFAPPKPE